MTGIVFRGPKDPAEFPRWRFETLDIDYQPETRSIWMSYRADAPHCYTLTMLVELLQLRDSLRALHQSGATSRYPFRYLVMASKRPGVFSLGGDLATFAAAIRRNDLSTLVTYAHACVDLVYSYSQSLDLPIVTLCAVHGQCLGGALEAALAFDFIIAEEDAVFGLPEVMFNTFPGMGAVTMLTRRVGPALMQQIIMEGRTYTGRQMHELDVIDALSPTGRVKDAAVEWMREDGDKRWRRRRAIAEARRRCNPVTHDELIRITELWAECSARIDDRDLRHMDRLVRAQRRLSGAAAEIGHRTSGQSLEKTCSE
ncbi:enoyl-CoA hydratase/isomerase family protein [Methylocystis sp. WRRC1]|uniref:crotonase/enoyl-CoA hydratase family protein n=1 Tax=unclassified Methylocystis TaxID=2625913 RepID=UPI0001F8807E|nr:MULTISPECIES: crotonase/enoyl-CoA hydratase family protein [unclassified Methylocystis]MCC3244411.1 enoyl-CoA hydratase/isomerase family protein [Methylocystis sp. WRRC1]